MNPRPRRLTARVLVAVPTVLAVVLAPSVAAAEYVDTDDAPPATTPAPLAASTTGATATAASPTVARRSPKHEPFEYRWEAGLGVRWGSFLVNNVATVDTVHQFHADGGIRFHDNRILLYAQYALHSMQIPLDELAASGGAPVTVGNGRGLMHRLGGQLRYSFARLGEHEGGMDIYADAGVGVQHIRWDAGGAWTRPDVSLSLGLTGFGMGDTRHGGMSVAMVLVLAPRNDVDGAGMACGGPCDYATPPTGFDRSFMFDVTVNFGK